MPTFKMEGAGMLRDLLQRNDWLVSMDLVDSALMVISVADITKADRPNVSHNAGSITGNIVLSKSAKDEKSGAQPLPFIQGNGNIG